MNQLVLYAKCACIRDKQLIEHHEIEKQRIEEEKLMDKMMELERLRCLKMHAEREEKRNQIQKAGALIVVDQIKERGFQRQMDIEEKLKEQELLKKQAKELENLEIRQSEMKINRAIQLRKEIETANKESIINKMKKKEEDLEMDKKIMEYIKLKAERDEQLLKDQKLF